jgi:N-methylhydantoinase B/oxoprolinase/acetone carboxylase alpha subunit
VKVIERELFRNLLISVAEEMGTVLRRTAFSPNIKERRDYSCAVYDAAGETVAMGDHMPVHRAISPSSTILFKAARTCRTSPRFRLSS